MTSLQTRIRQRLTERTVVESAYERADEFIPERWTSKPEMIRDRRAYAPFSQGKNPDPGPF